MNQNSYNDLLMNSVYGLLGDLKFPKKIIHRATCPLCDRKLVNLYVMHGTWGCKTCLDRAVEVSELMKKED